MKPAVWNFCVPLLAVRIIKFIYRNINNTHYDTSIIKPGRYGGAVVSTDASQQEDPGFDSRPGQGHACVSSLGAPTSSHCPKTCKLG